MWTDGQPLARKRMIFISVFISAQTPLAVFLDGLLTTFLQLYRESQIISLEFTVLQLDIEATCPYDKVVRTIVV